MIKLYSSKFVKSVILISSLLAVGVFLFSRVVARPETKTVDASVANYLVIWVDKHMQTDELKKAFIADYFGGMGDGYCQIAFDWQRIGFRKPSTYRQIRVIQGSDGSWKALFFQQYKDDGFVVKLGDDFGIHPPSGTFVIAGRVAAFHCDRTQINSD